MSMVKQSGHERPPKPWRLEIWSDGTPCAERTKPAVENEDMNRNENTWILATTLDGWEISRCRLLILTNFDVRPFNILFWIYQFSLALRRKGVETTK